MRQRTTARTDARSGASPRSGARFRYRAIAPAAGLGRVDGLAAAIRADSRTLAAFELGMFGWMILVQLVVFAGMPLRPDQPVYWLMMQIGMVLGFGTSYPANRFLVRRGIKEAM